LFTRKVTKLLSLAAEYSRPRLQKPKVYKPKLSLSLPVYIYIICKVKYMHVILKTRKFIYLKITDWGKKTGEVKYKMMHAW